MRYVNEQLRACGQLRGDHPLIRLIQHCLHNGPHKRPSIREVLRLLEEARAGVGDEGSERNKRELVRALQTQPRNQNLERVLRDLVIENADLQSRVQAKDMELVAAQQQLRRNETELTGNKAELTRKEAEMTRAEETIRREQQQIQEMRQRETELVQAKDREIALLQQQLGEKVQPPLPHLWITTNTLSPHIVRPLFHPLLRQDVFHLLRQGVLVRLVRLVRLL
ncbi:hypothetical protein GBAR_LOCUS17816 [Geodia barretti]|uniref:Uncharacterized protein n=1 Tax=Geodia barretti TaxID=519541 RepID=A0AA35SKQ3_GEOBA|nr:hypothetical protein GBAR_LOCUS17816 [Geodia barretti]